jgi:hypothetical protein
MLVLFASIPVLGADAAGRNPALPEAQNDVDLLSCAGAVLTSGTRYQAVTSRAFFRLKIQALPLCSTVGRDVSVNSRCRRKLNACSVSYCSRLY